MPSGWPGALKWSYQTGRPVGTSPALAANGTLYLGFQNRLGAISPPSSGTAGVLKWSYRTQGWIESSPAIGADGTVYVGSQDGRLYAIQ